MYLYHGVGENVSPEEWLGNFYYLENNKIKRVSVYAQEVYKKLIT